MIDVRLGFDCFGIGYEKDSQVPCVMPGMSIIIDDMQLDLSDRYGLQVVIDGDDPRAFLALELNGWIGNSKHNHLDQAETHAYLLSKGWRQE